MNDLNNGCGPRCCQIFTWQRVMERERIPSIIFNQDRSTLAYIPLKNITRTTSRMPCIKLKTVPAIKHSAPLMRSSWSAKLIHYSSSSQYYRLEPKGRSPTRTIRRQSWEYHQWIGVPLKIQYRTTAQRCYQSICPGAARLYWHSPLATINNNESVRWIQWLFCLWGTICNAILLITTKNKLYINFSIRLISCSYLHCQFVFAQKKKFRPLYFLLNNI